MLRLLQLTAAFGIMSDMTPACVEPPAITLSADMPRLAVIDSRKVGAVADSESDGRLSGAEAAQLLGIDRIAVYRAPREELPYIEKGGGSMRKGRRRYLPEDVETYRRRMTGEIPTWAEEIKARVSSLESRLDEHLRDHD